jgi:DNA end-binding protein Ku
VIDSLAGEFDPGELTSQYRQNLRQMLEAKLEGQEIVRPEPEEEETPVVDLMEALRRSVEEVKEKPARKKTRAASKGGSRKRVAARKSA